MDEIEDRLAALELMLVELMADVEAGRLKAALDRVVAGLPEAVDEREASIRRQAIQHIEDALWRHDGFSTGSLSKPPRA